MRLFLGMKKIRLEFCFDINNFQDLISFRTSRFVPTKANRRTKAMSEEIRSLLKGIIKQREKAMESEKAVGSEGDLLGTLMESNREAHGLSIEEVIEECKLFYFAGSETTSLVVVWTLVMLSKHQEWQARAREEVLQVFGERHPSYDGLSRLKVVRSHLPPPTRPSLRAW